MDSWWLDLKYACRALLKRPGFTWLAVVTLALGLGVNTVAFSAIDALLLRPFRMADGAPGIGHASDPGLDRVIRGDVLHGLAAQA